ncbi:hypothetical protein DAI22_02g333601 [Oryza sativa Japonica Group]|nr:hypothetical protein DAI22_02g333601 [Oryza sativa Japonica Group]
MDAWAGECSSDMPTTRQARLPLSSSQFSSGRERRKPVLAHVHHLTSPVGRVEQRRRVIPRRNASLVAALSRCAEFKFRNAAICSSRLKRDRRMFVAAGNHSIHLEAFVRELHAPRRPRPRPETRELIRTFTRENRCVPVTRNAPRSLSPPRGLKRFPFPARTHAPSYLAGLAIRSRPPPPPPTVFVPRRRAPIAVAHLPRVHLLRPCRDIDLSSPRRGVMVQ